MKIKSDNKKLQEKLGQLEGFLIKQGAWFHPNVIINCSENAMSIEAEDSCDPEEIIIKIPEDLLIPLDGLNISVKENKFIINPDKDKLSPELIAVSELIFELYNLSEKVDFYKNESPWFTFRESPKLLIALLRSRSMSEALNAKDFFLRKVHGSMTIEEFIAYDFPQSRALATKNRDNNEIVPKLVPIVDYLDHDYRGSPFIQYGHQAYTDDDGFLKIKNMQPFPSSPACYATYGIYDTVDTFLNYGFIYEETPFLRSIPLEVPLSNMNNLIINSHLYEYEQPTPSHLSDLKKKLISMLGYENYVNQPTLPYLIISSMPTQPSTSTTLQTLIEKSVDTSVSCDFILDRVHQAEKFIIEKNIDFYDALMKKADNDKKTPEALTSQIKKISSIQLNILHKCI